MTTAIIGTGGVGSVIARQLASGGETLRLSSADHESARTLAAEIGRAAVVAAGNRDALQGWPGNRPPGPVGELRTVGGRPPSRVALDWPIRPA